MYIEAYRNLHWNCSLINTLIKSVKYLVLVNRGDDNDADNNRNKCGYEVKLSQKIVQYESICYESNDRN